MLLLILWKSKPHSSLSDGPTDPPTHPPTDLRPASRSMIKILSDCCSALPFAFAWLLRKLAPTLRTPLLHRCRLAAPPSFPIWLPVPLPLPTFASGHSPHQPTPAAISSLLRDWGCRRSPLPLSSQINLGVDVTCCRWTRLFCCQWPGALRRVVY